MLYWSPTEQSVTEYIPTGGWNPVFSNQDKIKCTALYIFFRKKYSESNSQIMSQMIMYKQKYKVNYSEEQEDILSKALLTGK
jgi:hypothetical protein